MRAIALSGGGLLDPIRRLVSPWNLDRLHPRIGTASPRYELPASSNLNDFTKVFPNGLPSEAALCPIWDPHVPTVGQSSNLDGYAIWNPTTTYAAGAAVGRA